MDGNEEVNTTEYISPNEMIVIKQIYNEPQPNGSNPTGKFSLGSPVIQPGAADPVTHPIIVKIIKRMIG